VNAIQDETTVGEVARELPTISVALENRKANHQTTMVEIEGTVSEKPISILIDPEESLSYISPIIVEKNKLAVKKFDKPWLVQLATGTKRKLMYYVENCKVFMNDLETQVKLNVLPLGSYDILIGMDWLEEHRVLLDYFGKSFTCLNDQGETVTVKGIPRKTFVRQISALQMKRVAKKGCKIFVVHVVDGENKSEK